MKKSGSWRGWFVLRRQSKSDFVDLCQRDRYLRLVTEFPDQLPVMLSGFADIEDGHPAH